MRVSIETCVCWSVQIGCRTMFFNLLVLMGSNHLGVGINRSLDSKASHP